MKTTLGFLRGECSIRESRNSNDKRLFSEKMKKNDEEEEETH